MTAVGASFTEVYSSALRGEACRVVGLSTDPQPLPVNAWIGERDGDAEFLALCEGSCVDVGCGPGRMTQALAERGHVVLGVDPVPEAVMQARDRGAAALLRNVFEPLPGEGRWDTALLADGNIGIGGDPLTLLGRLAQLLTPQGRVVLDVEPPGVGVQVRRLSLETRSHRSRVFPWAVVGADAVSDLARSSGFTVASIDRHGDRWLALLCKGSR